MGFDDLARHMAARDGRKQGNAESIDPDQIVAEAIQADRRMNRIRDLFLGPILLVGGLGAEWLIVSTMVGGTLWLSAVTAAAVAILAGLLMTIRGLRRRPSGRAPEQLLDGYFRDR